MAPAAVSALSFSVRRRSNPVLVAPAEPTPHEFKPLSDIDLQRGQRSLVTGLWFYAATPAMRGKDPAAVVRDALSKALVHYYPFAGRLRGEAGSRLVVECTGEGALLAEADADVRLEQYIAGGELLRPPFPRGEEFFCDAAAGGLILDSPLLQVQVTRLACGGFVMGVRHNHVMADAQGLVQLLQAMGELARGAPRPTLPPVWRRELLAARDPPMVTCVHPEFEDYYYSGEEATADWVLRSFFFSSGRLAELKNQLRSDSATTFDVLAAHVWRCRTAALRLGAEEVVRLLCFVTARGRFPALVPDGYYGNSFVHPTAMTTAGELVLCGGGGLERAVGLVREAKAQVTEEYMRSAADLSATRGWPWPVTSPGTMMVSDLRRVGFREVDFGWGEAVSGGTSDTFASVTIFAAHRELCSGEDGVLVSIRLPPAAMERFAGEIMKA